MTHHSKAVRNGRYIRWSGVLGLLIVVLSATGVSAAPELNAPAIKTTAAVTGSSVTLKYSLNRNWRQIWSQSCTLIRPDNTKVRKCDRQRDSNSGTNLTKYTVQFSNLQAGNYTYNVYFRLRGGTKLHGAQVFTINPTITPGPATWLDITGLPSTPVVAGTPMTFTVTARDADNNVATGFRDTVHFQALLNWYKFPNEVVPPDFKFTEADAGTHTFVDGVTMIAADSNANQPGRRQVVASDNNDGDIIGYADVFIHAGPAAQLEIFQQFSPFADPEAVPASYPVDLMPFYNGAQQLTLLEGADPTVSICLEVFDSYGNYWDGRDTNQDRNVSLTWIAPAGATLPADLPTSWNPYQDFDPSGSGLCLKVQLPDYTDAGKHQAGLTLAASMPAPGGGTLTTSQDWHANFVTQDIVVQTDPLPDLQGDYWVMTDDSGVTDYVSTNVDLTENAQTTFFTADGGIVAQYTDVPMVECTTDHVCTDINAPLSVSTTTGTTNAAIVVSDYGVWGMADPRCGYFYINEVVGTLFLCESLSQFGGEGSVVHRVNVQDSESSCNSAPADVSSSTNAYKGGAPADLTVVAFDLSKNLCSTGDDE